MMSDYNPLYPVRGMNFVEKKSFRDSLVAIDKAMPWVAQDAGRNAGVEEARTHGICDLIYRRYDKGLFGRDSQGHTIQTTSFLPWVARVAKSWPDYSGSKTYPVPAPKRSSHTCSSIYNVTHDMWAGEYGLLRKRLLNHLILTVSDEIEREDLEERIGALSTLSKIECCGEGYVLYHPASESLIASSGQLASPSLCYTELDQLGAVWETYEEAQAALEEAPFEGVLIGKVEETISTQVSVYKPKEAL